MWFSDKIRRKRNKLAITEKEIHCYLAFLKSEERAKATVEKYGRDVRAFAAWIVSREQGQIHVAEEMKTVAIAYKREIVERYAATSVNSMLASLNGFFTFMGWGIRVKAINVQRRTFAREDQELTRGEYERLLAAAREEDDERLCLLMQAICATGIRVSELVYITVEAARAGEAEITNKGKTRIVFLPEKLQRALLEYAKKQRITFGAIFVTKSGKPLDRSNIWSAMKTLCESAGVAPSRVFPHNLRHLFARIFYQVDKDVVRLADLLGHSSIDTTRIYIMESGAEHRKQVNLLGLAT